MSKNKQKGKRLTIVLDDDLYEYIDRKSREDYSNRVPSKGAVIRRIIRAHKEGRKYFLTDDRDTR